MKLLFAFLLIVTGWKAQALEISEWKEKDYLASRSKVQTYVLHFYAEWCSVCLAQKKAIRNLESDKDLKDLKVYLVDFDFQRKLKAEYGVERQSTMILMRGEQEISRIMGITDPEKIKDFLKKAAN